MHASGPAGPCVFGCGLPRTDGLKRSARCQTFAGRVFAAGLLGRAVAPLHPAHAPMAALGLQPPDVELAASALAAYHTLRSDTCGRPGGAPDADDEDGVVDSNYQIRVLMTVRAAARCHGLSARLLHEQHGLSSVNGRRVVYVHPVPNCPGRRPGCLGPGLGPSTSFPAKTGPKPAPDARPGDRKRYWVGLMAGF